MDRRLLSLTEIAEFLGVSRPTARRYTKDLSFPNPIVLPGGTLRWVPEEFESWLRGKQSAAVTDLGSYSPHAARPGLTQKQRQAAGRSKQRQAAHRLAERLTANEEDSNSSGKSELGNGSPLQTDAA